MLFSLTKNQYDNAPITADMSWEALAQGLSEPLKTKCHPCPSLTVRADGTKGDKCEARKVGMFGAQVFDGHGKKLENVVSVNFLMFDIDHKPRANIAAICDAVTREGLESIIYSTHSHDPDRGDYCIRLMLPLTAPVVMSAVGQDRYRNFYRAVAERLGVDFDQQTKDQTRLVFQPTVPEGGPKFLFTTTHGKSVDYFEAMPIRGGVDSSVPVEGGSSVSPSSGAVSDIGELFTKILRSKMEPEFKEAFKRSREGKPFAAEGSRDTTLYKAASKAVFCCYDADLYSLLELFRGGCNAMAPRTDPDGRTWLQKVEFDLERAVERREAERERDRVQQEIAVNAGYAASAASVPAGEPVSAVAGPYTPDELAGFYASQGCANEAEFRTRWVVRKEGANWIFENGRYGKAISDRDMQSAIGRNLARSGLLQYTEGKDGAMHLKPWLQIVEGLQSQAEGGVSGSLTLDKSVYLPGPRKFLEAICPPRLLTPAYDADVEEWFARFKSEKFLDWLAAFPDLNRTTALLYLDGPKGVGKTLLPTALSRLWREDGGPALFADVIGTTFNSDLADCPLVFADEEIPKLPGIMAKIRALLAAPSFSLNRKFLPTVKVTGKIRMIVSGNDDELLNTEAALGEKGVEAVSDRILYLSLSEAPGEWIRHLVKTKGSEHIAAWVKSDVVIRHVLWLGTQRTITKEGSEERAVGGGSQEFTETLTTTTGNVPAVLEFLARFLSEPTSTRQPTKLAKIGQGRLLVSTELLSDKAQFEKYVPSAQRVLPAAKISKALQQIRERAEQMDGRWYHAIRVSTVLDWMLKNQVGDYNEAKARIEAP